MDKNSVSIILPTYNERKNIQILIPKVVSIMDSTKKKYEIIVVDDSSPDGTRQKVLELKKKYDNLKLLVRKKKCGIGAALRHGYNIASNDIIISSDTFSSRSPPRYMK